MSDLTDGQQKSIEDLAEYMSVILSNPKATPREKLRQELAFFFGATAASSDVVIRDFARSMAKEAAAKLLREAQQ